jgi:osomolarity two-component system, response regulator SKN7
MHLKVIQTMQRIPRSIGIPPLSDSNFDQALTIHAANMVAAGSSSGMFSLGEDEGKINPLAGMGLSDEQYTMILQNMVTNDSFMGSMGMEILDNGKRALDDSGDGRDGKRGRFEVIE